VEKRRRKMHQHKSEEREGKIVMRAPEECVQGVALRQYRGEPYAAIEYDWISGGGQHRPPDQGHPYHQHVQTYVGQMGGKLHRFRKVCGQRWSAGYEANREANQGKDKNGDP
jgi:hypothetical protein